MHKKFALTPFGAKTQDFHVGQSVQLLITSHYGSAFIGTVLAIFPSTDKVHVQWPHQVGQHSPEDLLPVTEAIGIKPTVTHLLSSDKSNSSSPAEVAIVTAHLSKVAKALKLAYSLKLQGLSEVSTFSKVSSLAADEVSDEEIRFVVASLFDSHLAQENSFYLTVIRNLLNA